MGGRRWGEGGEEVGRRDRKEQELTSSGSARLTLRPGLTFSGKTHSFVGLAKILPLLEEVSLRFISPSQYRPGSRRGHDEVSRVDIDFESCKSTLSR